jgi:hypothetical protein
MHKLLLVTGTLFASLVLNAKTYTIEEIQKPHRTYTRDEAAQMIPEFTQITGESQVELNKMIAKTVNDKDWQTGTNSFRNDFKTVDIHGSKKVIPQWKPALVAYKKSVNESGNIISAYQGLTIVAMYFTGLPAGDQVTESVINEFLPVFSKTLAEKGYCYGYLYSIKNALDYENKIDLAVEIGERGLPICAKQVSDKKISKWIDIDFRKEFVKAKNLKRMRDGEVK